MVGFLYNFSVRFVLRVKWTCLRVQFRKVVLFFRVNLRGFCSFYGFLIFRRGVSFVRNCVLFKRRFPRFVRVPRDRIQLIRATMYSYGINVCVFLFKEMSLDRFFYNRGLHRNFLVVSYYRRTSTIRRMKRLINFRGTGMRLMMFIHFVMTLRL